MANKDKILNLPWQIGREFTVFFDSIVKEKKIQKIKNQFYAS
jgi:hypothetical protein